ncbi:orotidine-5'-phosphate decarboxylase [Aurantibacillus circumpalustris]|uniref:orotidine-5'-phosphate decarboxylase n=1 Tax=Aurantibacillus circumpalustris TaxID=3036359 RepID=UPI00295C14AF|nr:orotidine-5'-phosphate decarboxylase [Aurantibacillus circumpalustris]
MTKEELVKQIRTKKTFLSVGLDPDSEKLPKHLLEDESDPIYEFNKAIVDATAPYCVSFKPNSAFYEAYGLNGIASLEKTIRYIKTNYPNHFLIADAKRGDIGNTSAMYAKAFFRRLNCDAITVAPYMGSDSVKPFLQFENKWAIVLGLTSNEGSSDFQQLKVDGNDFYMHVIETCAKWGTQDNMMFVIGATKANLLEGIRKIIPNHFLLIPGVGAQGGSLQDVCKYGMNKEVGLLVNSSRGIIYASSGKDFAEKAGAEAKKIAQEMSGFL